MDKKSKFSQTAEDVVYGIGFAVEGAVDAVRYYARETIKRVGSHLKPYDSKDVYAELHHHAGGKLRGGEITWEWAHFTVGTADELSVGGQNYKANVIDDGTVATPETYVHAPLGNHFGFPKKLTYTQIKDIQAQLNSIVKNDVEKPSAAVEMFSAILNKAGLAFEKQKQGEQRAGGNGHCFKKPEATIGDK
jgi:hypothetical protein